MPDQDGSACTTTTISELDIKVTISDTVYQEVREFVPVSASMREASFHPHRVTWDMRNLMYKAFGSQGQFPDRKTGKNRGHNTLIARKLVQSSCNPTPSEGPGMSGHFQLYRSGSDERYLPTALRFIENLTHVSVNLL